MSAKCQLESSPFWSAIEKVTPPIVRGAIGSGSSYALGALHVLYNRRGDAEKMARAAAEAAIAFDTHCGGEVRVERVALGKRPRRR